MPDIFTNKEDEMGESGNPSSKNYEQKNAASEIGQDAKKETVTAKHVRRGLGGKPSSLKEMDTLKIKSYLPELSENTAGGPISAFNYYPKNVNFINKDPEEKVILFLRRHPVTNLPWVLASFVIIVLPAFLTVLPLFDNVPPKMMVLAVLIWYLATTAYIFEKFLDWFFSVNIVTDERIFDVDFYNLAYRKMTDANIDQIQDVTVQIGGGLRTMFNFGDVLIQTAAEVPEIEFEAIPQPDKVAKILRELRVEEEEEKLEGRVR